MYIKKSRVKNVIHGKYNIFDLVNDGSDWQKKKVRFGMTHLLWTAKQAHAGPKYTNMYPLKKNESNHKRRLVDNRTGAGSARPSPLIPAVASSSPRGWAPRRVYAPARPPARPSRTPRGTGGTLYCLRRRPRPGCPTCRPLRRPLTPPAPTGLDPPTSLSF